ncbi:zinc-binding dehydrogenase [bacterium]|nr:zinc-binding dehydrogenase [bacterium]
MRAAVLVKNGNAQSAFEIQERPDPLPGDFEVLVQVHVSGLNFADVMARLGLYPEAPPIPSILGYEVAGTIAKLGNQVKGLKVGDRVLAMTRFGGYATRAVAPALATVVLPDSISFEAATALGTQAITAYYLCEEMIPLLPDQHVLIHAAAGGVGSILVQLAKHRDCIVYGTSSSPAKLEFLKKLGVDHPINYTEKDFAAEFLRLSGGRKADAIFDSIGGSHFKKGFRILGAGGRIGIFGVSEMAGGKKSLLRSLRTLFSFGLYHPLGLLMHSKGIVGVNMLKVGNAHPETIGRCLKAVVALTDQGVIQPQIGGIFPAEKIGEAHEKLANRSTTGKLGLSWS